MIILPQLCQDKPVKEPPFGRLHAFIVNQVADLAHRSHVGVHSPPRQRTSRFGAATLLRSGLQWQWSTLWHLPSRRPRTTAGLWAGLRPGPLPDRSGRSAVHPDQFGRHLRHGFLEAVLRRYRPYPDPCTQQRHGHPRDGGSAGFLRCSG